MTLSNIVVASAIVVAGLTVAGALYLFAPRYQFVAPAGGAELFNAPTVFRADSRTGDIAICGVKAVQVDDPLPKPKPGANPFDIDPLWTGKKNVQKMVCE